MCTKNYEIVNGFGKYGLSLSFSLGPKAARVVWTHLLVLPYVRCSGSEKNKGCKVPVRQLEESMQNDLRYILQKF